MSKINRLKKIINLRLLCKKRQKNGKQIISPEDQSIMLKKEKKISTIFSN